MRKWPEDHPDDPLLNNLEHLTASQKESKEGRVQGGREGRSQRGDKVDCKSTARRLHQRRCPTQSANSGIPLRRLDYCLLWALARCDIRRPYAEVLRGA